VDPAAAARCQSIALQAEVRLADTLDRVRRLQPAPAVAAAAEGRPPGPTALGAAVCCQLLGEFAQLCGPFAGVLTTLRDELAGAVFSDYYEPGACPPPSAFCH